MRVNTNSVEILHKSVLKTELQNLQQNFPFEECDEVIQDFNIIESWLKLRIEQLENGAHTK
ncbi:MAG TPA: hypothetical protein DEO59_11460 [Balneola sp.]|jgi:hypothetical protein|nr:hypothetical protein [Balneola sp.]|tara:strand:+ start:467 stop:649 length:183 start_codon:yes stop_codon:yes gene_type:complete